MIRVIQFNADRGRAATSLVEKVFVERYDVALVQDPYVRHEHRGEYRVHKSSKEAKAVFFSGWKSAFMQTTSWLLCDIVCSTVGLPDPVACLNTD